MSNLKSRREARQTRRKKQQLHTRLIWGGIGIAVLAVIGVGVWNTIRPPVGDPYPILSPDHIEDGIEPTGYNSNPPTSGPHYARGLDRGFFDESDLPNLPPFPEGGAVHNLEHGYIVFWYNCTILEEAECAELKSDIRTFMSTSTYSKLIALPWDSTDVPLALTSWGYLLEMETFSSRQARNFIQSNWRNAPEATAP